MESENTKEKYVIIFFQFQTFYLLFKNNESFDIE